MPHKFKIGDRVRNIRLLDGSIYVVENLKEHSDWRNRDLRTGDDPEKWRWSVGVRREGMKRERAWGYYEWALELVLPASELEQLVQSYITRELHNAV